MAIRDQFAELCSTLNALDPPLDPMFQPPASEAEISAAESALGLSFPNDLKELLLCANGQDLRGWITSPVFPTLRLEPDSIGSTSHTWFGKLDALVEQTRQHRLEFLELKDDGPFEAFGPVRFHDNVIVFTITENADNLVIDLQPCEGGQIGQIIMVCTQPFLVAVVAPSLYLFLRRVVDGYRSGRCKLIHRDPCQVWSEL